MSVNDRIEIQSGDVGYGQKAPSQAHRTNFTPGKASASIQEQNWPQDFRIPTGTPAFDGEAAGPVEMVRSRVIKLGRLTVCDQVFPIPHVTGTRVETRKEVGINGTDTVTDTLLPAIPGLTERRTGSDNIVGA